jgi:hypothetical protein
MRGGRQRMKTVFFPMLQAATSPAAGNYKNDAARRHEGYRAASRKLFLLVPIFSQSLFSLMSGDFVSLSFFSARHNFRML